MTGKLIILDRDGVINEDSDAFIKGPEEWHAIPGSLEAIARLNHAGFVPIIISNQSGLARGLFTLDDLNAIHSRMRNELAPYGGHVEAILFCPHGPAEGCVCRKPKPGLFQVARERFCQDLTEVVAIGDSIRDIQAARAAGARPVLVRTGKGMHTLRAHAPELGKTPIYDNLAQTVESLLISR